MAGHGGQEYLVETRPVGRKQRQLTSRHQGRQQRTRIRVCRKGELPPSFDKFAMNHPGQIGRRFGAPFPGHAHRFERKAFPHFVHGAIEDHFAAFDQADGIADFFSLSQHVGRKNDCGSVFFFFQDHLPQQFDIQRVQAAEHFIKDHQIWLGNERRGELDFLLHALAQGVHLAVAVLHQSQAFEPMVGAHDRLAAGHTLELGQIGQLFHTFHFSVQATLFGQVADAVAHRAVQQLAAQPDLAAVRQQNLHDGPDGGGLAGPVGPQEAVDGTARNAQIHVLCRPLGPVGFVDRLEREDGLPHGRQVESLGGHEFSCQRFRISA